MNKAEILSVARDSLAFMEVIVEKGDVDPAHPDFYALNKDENVAALSLGKGLREAARASREDERTWNVLTYTGATISTHCFGPHRGRMLSAINQIKNLLERQGE